MIDIIKCSKDIVFPLNLDHFVAYEIRLWRTGSRVPVIIGRISLPPNSNIEKLEKDLNSQLQVEYL